MIAEKRKQSCTLETAVALAREALTHWPGILSAPTLVMHRENTVFRVETTAGPAALRLHREGYHALAAIRSELDWMAYLTANGIDVPAPIAARDGHRLVVLPRPDGSARALDLLTWLDGTKLGETGKPLAGSESEQEAAFHALGRMIARLHALSDAWALPKDFVRHHWDTDGLVGEDPFWGRFWQSRDLSAVDRAVLLAARDRLRRDLHAYRAGGADYGLIHADLVRENVLIDAHGAIRLIDFDDAGFGFRMFDIATALIKNRAEPHFEAMKLALLAGYSEIRPLRLHDLSALPLMMLARALTYLGWADARAGEQGMAARQQRFLDEALALARNYPGAEVPH